MKANTAAPFEFDDTLKNSIAVVSHVWSQVNALKGKLDADFPSALISEDVRLDEELEDDWDVVDAFGSLVSVWAWGYGISVRPRGKWKMIGWIYVLVRVAPAGNDEAQNATFVPYISLHIDHKDCGQTVLAEFQPVDSYTSDDMVADGWKPMSKPTFPIATLGCFECKNKDGLGAVAAHIPLRTLRSDNVETLLIKPFAKLANYCKEAWA